MKVLMSADAVGGVWGYCLDLADALAPHGVEVTLAVLGPPMSEGQRRQVDASAVAAVHELDVKLEWMDEPWEDVDVAGRWLLDLADEIGVDLVHVNGYAHAALRWSTPAVAVAHSDVFSWWAAVRGETAPPEWEEYRRRVTAGLAAADAVIAPTAAVLRDLRRWYGFDGGRVIPNGRSGRWVIDAPKERLVVGAGRVWDEAKNLTALDRAARQLDCPVVIAGDAEGVPLEAAEAAGRLPLEELAVLLARASVFALPARYEPFGLGPLEAALSGCALVLGDIPSLREVWGEAALYVDPGDDGALVAVVGHLLADRGVAAAWGARARRRAGMYSTEATAAAYFDTYRALVRTRTSR